MTHIKLMGELGKKFGTDWYSGSNTVRDALKLIDCQVDGFKEYLSECQEKNIQFSIENGKDFIEEFEELTLQGILKDTLIITPVPAGSGKGLGKLIAGVLLIAAMFMIPGLNPFTYANTTGGAVTGASGINTVTLAPGVTGVTTTQVSASAMLQGGATITGISNAGLAVMMLGTNLALMGLSEMSAPDSGSMESDPAFLFNGANNSIEQGQPVPVLYGTVKIGGTPISQGFKPGQLKGRNYSVSNASSAGYIYYGTASSGTNATTSTNSSQSGGGDKNETVSHGGIFK